jgi:dTDP-4-dehydrorhamnose 3,5-epimerase
MGKFEKIPVKLNGVFLVQPKIFRDSRGFFLESYNKEEFDTIGIDMEFVQDNHSCSSKGVIRGMHYQTTFPQ